MRIELIEVGHAFGDQPLLFRGITETFVAGEVMAGRGSVVVIATHDPRVRDGCTRVLDLAAYRAGDGVDASA